MHRWHLSSRPWLALTAPGGTVQSIALDPYQNTCQYLNLHGLFMMKSHVWILPSQFLSHLHSMPTRHAQHLHRSKHQFRTSPKHPSAVRHQPSPLTRLTDLHTSRVMSPMPPKLLPHHDVDPYPTQPPTDPDLPIDHDMRVHARLMENMAIPRTDATCLPWLYLCNVMPGIGPTRNLRRPWKLIGSNGTNHSYLVTIAHRVPFWLTTARSLSLGRTRWIWRWIGISSTTHQRSRRTLNDSYGKLVSRFPHLALTMVPQLHLLSLLTPPSTSILCLHG